MPTADQKQRLQATTRAFAGAVRRAARIGREAGTTGNARIHHLCYQRLREAFGLSANLAVRATPMNSHRT